MAEERNQPGASSHYCPQCGTGLEPGARFCPNCGATLDQGAAAGAAAPQPPYQMAQTYRGDVPNYLVQAILVTVFCCLPFGIVSIVFAAQVNGKLSSGDYAGAQDMSNKARTWAWVSFWLGLAGVIIWFLFAMVGGLLGFISS